MVAEKSGKLSPVEENGSFLPLFTKVWDSSILSVVGRLGFLNHQQ